MLFRSPVKMVKEAGYHQLKPDAVIVGAGISGITTARRLREAGLTVVLIEQARRLGGIWNGQGTYECLRLQQHRNVFHFDGIDWPASTPEYPSALDVRRQIAAYVDTYKLEECIQLGVKAESIIRDEATGLWRTKYHYIDENTTQVEIMSKYVALATGSLGSPNIPTSLESSLKKFQGSQLHSSDYYRPTAYNNAEVVIIGWGASSVEIAADLANRGNCASVTLVAPAKVDPISGKLYEDWCLSRELGPEAAQHFCADPKRPEASIEFRNEVLREAMAKRHPGSIDALPSPLRPVAGPVEGRIIISEAFNDAVLAGKIRVVAASICGAEPDALLVRDQSTNSVLRLNASDLVICTGYTPPLPRLSSLMQPQPTSIDLYDTMWSPECPNAAFLGLGFGFISIALLADVQAKRLAQVATGNAVLPSPTEMNEWIARTKTKNLMGTTQCLTDNTYFGQLLGNTQSDSKISTDTQKPMPRSGMQKRFSSVRQFSTQTGMQHEEPQLSSVGNTINSSRFNSHDPSKAYGAWAETYDDDSFEVLKFDSPYATRDYLVAYWPNGQDKNVRTQVLDVGCGTGAVARLVLDQLPATASHSCDWHGFDLTPEMLAVAKRRGQYNTLQQWSITDTPWPVPENGFDLASCNGVLMYVEPQLSVLAEFCRVVKADGHAILMIRDDNFQAWQSNIDELERQRAWRLVEVSESRDNFPGRENDETPITYRIYVFRILQRSKFASS